MKTFEQIQETLGELPNYPKVYLLGSTGAGKTSIVRAILDTEADRFPTTLQTRTTVAPTEYIISASKPFKSTFIFKEKENIENSIVEILVSTILKALSFDDDEDLNLVSYLEETPDERFRLKYLVSSEFLEEVNDYIIETLLPSIDTNQSNEELFGTDKVLSEIEYLVKKIFDAIEKTTKEICPDYELFSNELYTIENINNKKDFILKNKALLKSELNSISPLIEYARIEGNLLASWIPSEYEFILIDGEGIGHNLKEIKNSLSTRHLDFFNFSDSILLVEKSDDPFITGGKNAIETIFLNGYSKKFKLIFSKVDKLEVKDHKSALNRRIGNVENALKDSNIRFEVNKNQKYYLSNLNKNGNESTQKEIIRVFKNIIDEFLTHKENPIDLEYDFEELLIGLNTSKFLNNWHDIIDNEHWAIVKALTKRMILKEGEYRYLKPILDYHTLIMKEINIFLKNDNQLNSEIYYAQNQIKQKFSTELLKYIREKFMQFYESDWMIAHNKSGYGSGKERKILVEKIFDNFIPKDMLEDKYINFKNKIKKSLIDAGAKEISATVKISIKKIIIDNIYGNRSLKWDLNKNTNILIGKNGSGKSTVLKLLYAKFSNNITLLEKFKNPNIKVTVCKEYKNGESKEIIISDNAHLQKIDIELIDTFDIVSNSISECKENCDKELSLLDSELIKLMYLFNDYQIKLNKVFDEKNLSNQLEIVRILDDIGQGKLDEASKIQELTQSKDKIKSEVYKSLDNFRNIVDSMFKDTHKKINLESIEKSFSISSQNKELDPLELSSGEKQILIIFLTILLKENKPYILMMDEPENSLHSNWQINFIENIRKLNENVQIIIATHNPLLMLDREGSEIAKISVDSDVVDISGEGTKYMDVCATLLNYPQIISLVGKSMKDKIHTLFNLKNKDELTPDQKSETDSLEIELGKTVATNFIYDRHYLNFLKFIKDNKDIDFDKLTEVSDEEMDELLGEFKDLFDD